jgi:hypothetical protein
MPEQVLLPAFREVRSAVSTDLLGKAHTVPHMGKREQGGICLTQLLIKSPYPPLRKRVMPEAAT